MNSSSGADLGFPVGGGDNHPGGLPTYEFANFSENLHEIENISGHRGVHAEYTSHLLTKCELG